MSSIKVDTRTRLVINTNTSSSKIMGTTLNEIESLVTSPISKPLSSLVKLSSHRSLVLEIVMLKTLIKKCFKRFKTSKISRISSIINSNVNKYIKMELSSCLKDNLNSFLRHSSDQLPSFDQVENCMEKMMSSVQVLKVIVSLVNKSADELLYWIKLGHFGRQIKILTAVLARISVFCKSIVIYISQVYPRLLSYLEIVDLNRTKNLTLPRCFHLDELGIRATKAKQVVDEIQTPKEKSKKKKTTTMNGSTATTNGLNKTIEPIDVGEKISRTVFENNKLSSNGFKSTK